MNFLRNLFKKSQPTENKSSSSQKDFQLPDDPAERIKMLNQLGAMHVSRGNFDLAISRFQWALQECKQADYLELTAVTLNNMGEVHRNRSEYQQALEYYRQAIEIYERIQKTDWLGHTLTNVGLVYHHLGDYEQAEHCYQRYLLKKAG